MSSKELTSSLENYLEEMLLLEEENDEVRVTDLAERLNIAKSSVNNAISRLAESELVKYSKYSPIRLTSRGRKRAREIRKKHSLLKKFLETVLDVSPSVAEREACHMEHVVSVSTIKKLEKFMKNYNACKNSTLPEPEYGEVDNTCCLSQCSENIQATIIKITAAGELKQRLMVMGFTPGTVVTCSGKAPVGDPIKVNMRNFQLTLRKKEADLIIVRKGTQDAG